MEFAVSYLKIYACGTIFVMLAQGLNPFILTQGHSFLAMGSVLVGAVTNIALDPIFIFTFGMGVQGSSLATILSQLVSCVCILCFFFSRKSLFRFRVREMRFCFARVRSIVSLGVTPFVMVLTECAIQVVFNINLNRATGGDKDYTAALTVMLSALQLISLPLNGLGNGMQPFVSYNYGRGSADRLKKGIRYVTVIAFLFAAAVWSVSLAVPQIYARLFSASDSVTAIVKQYTPLFLMLYHVFRADDAAKYQCRPGAGNGGPPACGEPQGRHLNPAVLCADAFSGLQGRVPVRGHCRSRGGDHHKHRDLLALPTHLPRAGGAG